MARPWRWKAATATDFDSPSVMSNFLSDSSSSGDDRKKFWQKPGNVKNNVNVHP
jgi:hypothetical protein